LNSEARILADVIEDYVSDLPTEIANTDSMEVREELKRREVFLKDLLRRLGEGRAAGESAGRRISSC